MKKSFLLITFTLLLLKILLEYNYFNFVNPLFSYSGMMLNISIYKLAESYILFFSLIFFLNYLEKFNFTSKIFVFILFIVLYIPLSSMYWLQDNSRTFFYFVTIAFVLLIILLTSFPKFNIKTITEGKTLFCLIVIMTTLIVYGYLILDGSLSRLNFNLNAVYEFRELNNYSSNIFLSYLVPWQGYVVNLSVIGITLYKKKLKITTFFSFLQILLFAMTNHKSFLFAPILLVAIYFLNRKNYKEKYLLWFSSGSILAVTIATIVYKMSNSILLPSIIIRRMFFIPAYLHFLYYNFFQDRDKFYLSHSILNGIVKSEYNTTPVGLISQTLYNQDTGANVGFFADAYVNFGVFGIILYTIILFVFLKIIDSITDSVPNYISISILLIPFMTLINSAFFTSLLTHGILFSILMIWLSKGFFINKKN